MAQQAVKKQVPAAGLPPLRTPSPRVGKVKPGSWDYTRWRITISDPDAFMDFMRGYPNPDGVTLFLYRLQPPIDLSLIGHKESNIQKGGYADLNLFSFESVAEKFGRGKYNVKVTDSNRLEGQKEVIKGCQYKITDAEKPPVYDLRTLKLADPDAIDEVNRLISTGVLVRDAGGAPRLRTAADGAGPAPAPVAPVAGSDFLSRDVLGQVIVSMLNRGTANPHDAVKDTIEVAKLLQQPSVDVEGIVERVVNRLGAGRAAPREDAFTVYERIDGFLTKFGAKPAAGGNHEGSGNGVSKNGGPVSWVPHLPAVLSEARMLIPEVLAMLRELRAEREAGAPVQNGGGGQLQQQKQLTIEQRIEQVVRTGFQKMNEGVNGFDYAAYVCGFMPGGLEVYRFLEPQGAVGLIALCAMNPAARPLVNDPQIRPQLEAFLNDFFSFDPSPGEAEDSEGDGAGAPA